LLILIFLLFHTLAAELNALKAEVVQLVDDKDMLSQCMFLLTIIL
jgi:hypothetical protein